MEEFSFEKLRVYQEAVDFINDCFVLCDNLDFKYQSSIGDQMRRASLSVANNIAEGSSRRYLKEKKKFYTYALDSARECIPMFTILKMRKKITDKQELHFREKCAIICKMLNRLIGSVK